MTDHLGFLISDVGRLMRRRFDDRARAIGVTRAQWRVLTTLARNEGANQAALADLIEVEPITLCRMVDRLQDAGLVERRSDPADRRAWRIYLAGPAHAMLAELRTLADDLIERTLHGLDAGERAELSRLLGHVRETLVERGVNDGVRAHG